MLVANRFLHSIYCDDVRNEVGGKTTLVGIYDSQMNVSADKDQLPIAIPKLCIAVTAQTPKENPFRKLKFKLLRDGEVVQEITAGQELLDSSIEAIEKRGNNFHIYRALFVAQPLLLDSSFIFRVHAETESEELIAPALRVNLDLSSSEHGTE
ncbi:MAG: hypothetical protein ACXVH6_04450 [Halobacteriota archaeon]